MDSKLTELGIAFEVVIKDNNGRKEKWLQIDKINLLFEKSDDKKQTLCKVCKRPISTPGSSTSGLHTHGCVHKILAVKKTNNTKTEQCGVSNRSSLPEQKLTPFEILCLDFPAQAILTRLIAKDGLSFSVIAKSDDLRKALDARFLSEKISYVLPKADSTIKKAVMDFTDKAQMLLKQILKQKLESGARFSLCFDEWSSTANRRYMDVTLFGQSDEYWNLGLVRVVGKATAENLYKMVENRVATFGLSLDTHIVCLITDGAKVMEKIKNTSKLEHQLCISHGIQCAVIDVLYKKTVVDDKFDENAENLLSFPSESSKVGLEVKKRKKKAELKDGPVKVAVTKVRSLGHSFKMAAANAETLSEYVREDLAKKRGNNHPEQCIEVDQEEEIEEEDDDEEEEDDDDGNEDDGVGTDKTQCEESADGDADKNEAAASSTTTTTTTVKNKLVLPLKVDSQTRWSSLLIMLERFWEIREPLQHALLHLKLVTKFSFSPLEMYMIWCVVKALRPIALIVENLCRRDSNLLTARAALILLFYVLEQSKSNNPVSYALLRQLKIRMSQRFDKNSAILKYLSSGSTKNDYPEFCQNEGPSLVEDEVDEEKFDISDNERQKFADSLNSTDNIATHSLFNFPSKPAIKAHIVNVVSRLYPSDCDVLVQNDSISETENSDFSGEPPLKKFKSFGAALKTLHDKATAATSNSYNLPEAKTLLSVITQEMAVFEKCGRRGFYLEKVYLALLSVKPTSVESERSFSSSGYLCSKVRSSFNDDTLSNGCFSRNLFKNPSAYPNKST